MIILISLVVLAGGLLAGGCTRSAAVTEPRAAVIDQLSSLQTNQNFLDQTTSILAGDNLKVDVYQGNAVTVDLLRKLPQQGYRLIVFRAHAGLLGAGGKTISKTCVFTNEIYSESDHVTEQLTEKLAKARIDASHPWVFAVGADFVKHSMQGKFDRTVIIMMGCSTLYIEDLAQSFIEKGASVYFGWNASVGLDYTDRVTLELLQKLWGKKAAIGDAVAETLKANGPDPDFKSVLKYYPPASWDKTLSNVNPK
jgi:hypothetical protein